MATRFSPTLTAWLAVCLLAASASASVSGDGCDGGHDFLTIGDTAPALEVGHWLKGREIETFHPNRIYVIEFWATWCRPCRETMPLLSEIDARYHDDGVQVVGISDERLQTVVHFLTSGDWNDKTRYALGTDPDRSSQRDYMDAAAIGTIPTAFLIDRDGRIAWIGHPDELEDPLKQVIAGTWDRSAFRDEFEERIAPERKRFLRLHAMRKAYKARDWEQLLAMFDEAIEDEPDKLALKLQKFQIMIGDMNDPEQGYAYGEEILPEFWDSPDKLNQIAWYIVDYEKVETRNLEFALKVALRAVELSEYQNAAILDTVARVFYEQGDLRRAIGWQEKAVDVLRDDDRLGDQIRQTLEAYRAKRRESGGNDG